MRLLALMLILSLAPLATCSSPTDCTVRTKIVEIIYGAIDEGIQKLRLKNLLGTGWECTEEGIYSGGAKIGEKHTCTICD